MGPWPTRGAISFTSRAGHGRAWLAPQPMQGAVSIHQQGGARVSHDRRCAANTSHRPNCQQGVAQKAKVVVTANLWRRPSREGHKRSRLSRHAANVCLLIGCGWEGSSRPRDQGAVLPRQQGGVQEVTACTTASARRRVIHQQDGPGKNYNWQHDLTAWVARRWLHRYGLL